MVPDVKIAVRAFKVLLSTTDSSYCQEELSSALENGVPKKDKASVKLVNGGPECIASNCGL